MKFQFKSQFFYSKLGTGWVLINCSILFLAFPAQAQEYVDFNYPQLAQVTAVDELGDVRPTDWGYRALATLIQRYGAISGYPDGTFRGNRSLSRYEFAAALQGVLEQINNGTFVNREDLLTLRRLELEYRLPLAQIRTCLSDIEMRVTNLEINQFSATSKLQAEVIFALTEGRQANPTFIARTRLNFITSFTTDSRLITQLEAGNNGGDAISSIQNQTPNLLSTTGINCRSRPASGYLFAAVCQRRLKPNSGIRD